MRPFSMMIAMPTSMCFLDTPYLHPEVSEESSVRKRGNSFAKFFGTSEMVVLHSTTRNDGIE